MPPPRAPLPPPVSASGEAGASSPPRPLLAPGRPSAPEPFGAPGGHTPRPRGGSRGAALAPRRQPPPVPALSGAQHSRAAAGLPSSDEPQPLRHLVGAPGRPRCPLPPTSAARPRRAGHLASGAIPGVGTARLGGQHPARAPCPQCHHRPRALQGGTVRPGGALHGQEQDRGAAAGCACSLPEPGERLWSLSMARNSRATLGCQGGE